MLLASPSVAQGPQPRRFEFPAWSRLLSGTLGDRQIELRLFREGNTLTGRYCFSPCNADAETELETETEAGDPADLLALTGNLNGSRNNTAVLDERPLNRADTSETGTWTITLSNNGITGQWRNLDGSQTLPIALTQPPAQQPFLFLLQIQTTQPLNAGCREDSSITAIRVYNPNGQLQQTLPAASQNICGYFAPELIDLNFDGWPDLRLGHTDPETTLTSYHYWLFNPATRRFADAPAALQDIVTPQFDAEQQRLWYSWVDAHDVSGITVYRWDGNSLIQTDNARSFVVPVRTEDGLLYCHIWQVYESGRIRDIGAPQDEQGRISFSPHALPPQSCTPDFPATLAQLEMRVWTLRDGQPATARTLPIAREPIDTPQGLRFCPNIAVFSNGALVREVVISDEACWAEY